MTPSEMKPIPPPIVGYCRGTGKPLTAEQAMYVDGFLYSREYAEKLKQEQSPFTAAAAPTQTNPDVSPGWAFILGLIPGVGAIYNQQYGKGLLHIVVFAFLVTVLEKSNATAFFVPMLMGWLFYMPFEAYHTAKKRAAGQVPEEFSSVVDLPESAKRLPIGPILLILFGTMFLLDNFGLLYLDQFLRFWPLLLIGIGVSMLFHRAQKLTALSGKDRLGDSHAER